MKQIHELLYIYGWYDYIHFEKTKIQRGVSVKKVVQNNSGDFPVSRFLLELCSELR